MLGSDINFFSYDHADSKSLNYEKNLFGCVRTVYSDKFYSSVPLVQHLLEKKTNSCGTLRKKNRKIIPKDSVGAKLKFGKMVSKQNCFKNKVYNWLEKRIDFMISSVL